MSTVTRPSRTPGVTAALATVASALLLSLLALLSPVSTAFAVDNGTLGIRPQTDADFLLLNAAPGGSVATNAVVTNSTDEPVVLDIYPVDAQNTSQGSFAMAGVEEPREGVGAWTTLTAGQITVPPNSELVVPLEINIPAGTEPGDYAGGLIIQSPTVVGDTSVTEGNAAFRVDVIQRQGLRIYFTVEGQAARSLEAGELTWTESDGAVVVTLPISNTGNTILYPTAVLTGKSLLGDDADLAFTTPESILPGESFDLEALVTDAPLFAVGTVEAQLDSAAGSYTARSMVMYAPWWLVALTVAVLIALITGLWFVIRFITRARRALAKISAQDASRAATVSPGDRRPRGQERYASAGRIAAEP